MMKKLMFALIAAVCCSSLMASVLVYDYSASFKRIDVAKNPVKVKDDDKTYKLDSPKVASDKFTGYMVIEACKNCTETGDYMERSADQGQTLPGNVAVMYIKRNGSKSLESPYKNAVYRAIGRFHVNHFGAKSGIDALTGESVHSKKALEASGFLSYYVDAYGDANNGKPGFMGKGHSDQNVEFNWWANRAIVLPKDFDTVDHAGFGKVKLLKTEDDCGPGSECFAMQNLSGSMLAGFYYAGKCSTFLYDLCDKVGVRYAPIAGTFSLKLNNGLTFDGKDFRYSTFAKADEALLSKLGAAYQTVSGSKVAADNLFGTPNDLTTIGGKKYVEFTAEANKWK